MGLASYGAIKKRSLDEIPIFGQFGWDITGPSYVYPFARFENKELSPVFVAIDIVNSYIEANGARYFIKKCSVNRSMKNMKPFLGILVADRFSNDAFQLGKSGGIIFTTPDILFGKEIANSIRNLAKTLKNAVEIAAKYPERVFELFNSLSSIEGAAINLRGALFELIVGHLVYKGEGNDIDIGVKVRSPKGMSAEIDVRRVKGYHELAIYECKGYEPSTQIDDDEIKLWITKKIPIIREALMEETRFRNINMSFEYWTSGEFSNDALKLLKQRSRETKKYRIFWKNGKEILDYARKIQAGSIVDTLNQHYAQHPLSK